MAHRRSLARQRIDECLASGPKSKETIFQIVGPFINHNRALRKYRYNIFNVNRWKHKRNPASKTIGPRERLVEECIDSGRRRILYDLLRHAMKTGAVVKLPSGDYCAGNRLRGT